MESPGFETVTSVVQLLVSQPSTLNLALHVSSSNTTVEVDAAVSEVLDTANAAVGNAVDEKTVEALPMEGRNVPDLLSLQPGVLYLGHENNQDNDSRSGAVAGARSDQGNITLDGLDNNSVKGYAFTGVLRSTIDSVEEFKVTTSNNGADSGRSSGAQVNVVTRSGTNKLHGSLYEYNRNTATSANDWFNKNRKRAEGLPNKPGELIRNTFGAAIGGPVKKDKLYYFLNFEMQRTAEAQEETLIVPNAAFRAGSISYYYNNADRRPVRGNPVAGPVRSARSALLRPTARAPGDRAPTRISSRSSSPIHCPMAAWRAMDSTPAPIPGPPKPDSISGPTSPRSTTRSRTGTIFSHAAICRMTASFSAASVSRPGASLRHPRQHQGNRRRRNLDHQSEPGQQRPCRIHPPGILQRRRLQPAMGDARQRQQSDSRNLFNNRPRAHAPIRRRRLMDTWKT